MMILGFFFGFGVLAAAAFGVVLGRLSRRGEVKELQDEARRWQNNARDYNEAAAWYKSAARSRHPDLDAPKCPGHDMGL